MWLFIVAYKHYCARITTGSSCCSYSFGEIYICDAHNNTYTSDRLYKGYLCDKKNYRPSTEIIFDYCECRIPQEGEQYTFKSNQMYEAVFCYNYTNNPTKTPQPTRTSQPTPKLKVQSIRCKKPKTVLSIFTKIILFE